MIIINRSDHETMLEQLRSAYPLEACGFLAGIDGVVQCIYPVDNQLASPMAYEMDPHQQLEAMLDLEERGWELLAIYHSHPHGPETPSSMDIAQAYYPEAIYVIVSFRDRKDPNVRAFRIEDDQVSEVPYSIVKPT